MKPLKNQSPVKSEQADIAAFRELLSGIIDHYHQSLVGPNRRGIDGLKACGLSDIAILTYFKVGYADGTLKAKLTPAQLKRLQGIGLFDDKGEERLANRIVVPIFDVAGLPVRLYGRSLGDEGKATYLNLTSEQGIWNPAAASAYTDEIILIGDVFDGLALWQAGFKNIIAVEGGNPAPTAIVERQNVRKIILALSPSEEAAAKKLTSELAAAGAKIHRLHWPKEIESAFDYFQYNRALDFKGTDQTFRSLLNAAPRVGYTRKKTSRLTLVEKSADTALFKSGSVSYRVRGIDQTHLRVVLAAKTDSAQHIDHLDLYASRARKLFSQACAERLTVESVEIEEDLLTLLEQVEQLKQEEAVTVVQQPLMTSEDEKEAKAFLKAPQLLEQIATDLEAVGYVGESRTKKLAYLVGTSRRLPKPLSGIFRAQSGSGKSYLMECVAELMPPEDVHYFSRLTPQALYYLEPDALVHKLLIVDERDGSEEAEYPIRTLQTRRLLKLAVPVKDPSSGKIRTTVLEIRGPIAYMESTTNEQINPENANRCFEIYLDESEKQTRSIFAAQRRMRTLEGWQIERRKEKILRLHHNAQRLLRPLKIIIPYVDLIEFPTGWLRGRRDNDRFLSLIEGIAFLHQHQRTIGLDQSAPDEQPTEYIEANLDDYAHAYDLAHQVFAQAGSDLPKPVADFFEEMQELVERLAKERDCPLDEFIFSRRDIRQAVKLPDHILKRYMRQIEELEYVRVKRAPQGGSFRYRMAEAVDRPRQLDGLITPEALREKWDKWNKSGTGRSSRLSRSK
ncbi:toprim domain-containing protein [Methylacidiphilales bacterium]|nr:toprim domain-containing protein [Candidatus Methylacidiphilales bacterium]